MQEKPLNQMNPKDRVIQKLIEISIFMMLFFMMIRIVLHGFNVWLIASESLMLVSLFALWIIRKKEREKDQTRRITHIKIFLILMMAIHILWVSFLRFEGMVIEHLYDDLKVLFMLVALGLLSKKEGILYFEDFFKRHGTTCIKQALLQILKLFGALMVFLLIIGLVGLMIARDLIITFDIYAILLRSYLLFATQMMLYVLYEYTLFNEHRAFLETGYRSYTSKTAWMIRLVLMLLIIFHGVIRWIALFDTTDGLRELIWLTTSEGLLLSIWIATFQLIFYGVFFDGILKLKRPGNSNIRVIIWIILGQFVIQILSPLYLLYAIRFQSIVLISTILNVFEALTSLLMIGVGIMVYLYFKAQSFPKSKYFLASVIIQPIPYIFFELSRRFVNTSNILSFMQLNQSVNLVFVMATQVLMLYVVWHMSHHQTKVPFEEILKNAMK